jgi:hypothetical protein
MYKIKSQKTGLFSTGGEIPKWSKNGKVWQRKGDLSSHFTQLFDKEIYVQYDAIVIEYEFAVVGISEIHKWVEAAENRVLEREEESKARTVAWHKDMELAELKRLQEKYGKSS